MSRGSQGFNPFLLLSSFLRLNSHWPTIIKKHHRTTSRSRKCRRPAATTPQRRRHSNTTRPLRQTTSCDSLNSRFDATCNSSTAAAYKEQQRRLKASCERDRGEREGKTVSLLRTHKTTLKLENEEVFTQTLFLLGCVLTIRRQQI